MKLKWKHFLCLLVSLSMVLGLIPGMSLKVLAWDGNPYADYVNTTKTVKFNDIDWYIIADDSTAVDAGTITLLAKDPISSSKFADSDLDGNAYSSSKVKCYLDELTAEGGSFADVADAIVTIPSLTTYGYQSTEIYDTATNVKLYLLSTEEATAITNADVRKCAWESGSNAHAWWLRSPGCEDYEAALVFGSNGSIIDDGYYTDVMRGVRPALKLDLSKVTFDSATNTFSLKSYYNDYVNNTTTVIFNDIDWYIISDNSTTADSGTITLLSKDPIGSCEFNKNETDGNFYSSSVVKDYLDGLTAEGGSFAGVADAIVTIPTLTTIGFENTDIYDTATNVKLYLLSEDEANAITNVDVRKCSQDSGSKYNYWWLRSPELDDTIAACVSGDTGIIEIEGVTINLGVRPALKLDLSKVIFSSESATFSLKPTEFSVTLSGGANAVATPSTGTSQIGLTGAMTTVDYEAKDGYYFEEFKDIYQNGITVTRTSDTVVTVFGTPTADTSITVPDAVKFFKAEPTSTPTPTSTTTPASSPTPTSTPTPASSPTTTSTPTSDPSPTTEPSAPMKAGSRISDSNSNATFEVVSDSPSDPTVKYVKSNNKNAKSVTIPKTITVDGITYTVTEIAAKAFKNNKKLKKITIPETVVKIGNSAFYGCKSLTSIVIPENVTTIGTKVFYKCSKLKKINIKSNVLKKVGKDTFKGINKKAVIKVPKDFFKTYKKLLKNKGQKKSVKIKKK